MKGKERYIMGIDPCTENGGGSYAVYDTIENKIIESGPLEVLPDEPIKVEDGYSYNVKLIKEA